MAVLALLLAGCGGDDEDAETAPDARTAPVTETERERTETVEEEPAQPPRSTPESETPGGPGDEEPARTQALLTGRNGSISPRLVRVPPFIAVRVELHSADGDAYSLRFGTKQVSTAARETDSVLLAGLRPGERAVGEPAGGGSRVVIEASAEPGP